MPPYGRRTPLPLAPDRALDRGRRSRQNPGSRTAPEAAAGLALLHLDSEAHSHEEHGGADGNHGTQREDDGAAACGRRRGR